VPGHLLWKYFLGYIEKQLFLISSSDIFMFKTGLSHCLFLGVEEVPGHLLWKYFLGYIEKQLFLISSNDILMFKTGLKVFFF